MIQEEAIDAIDAALDSLNPQARLSVLNWLPQLIRGATAETVAELRDEGVTWETIGAMLGVTRQTAHERFAHLTSGNATQRALRRDSTRRGS